MSTYRPDREEVWTLMRQANLVKIMVEFSGGNDEGGTDGITGIDRNLQEKELPVVYEWNEQVWDHATRSWKERTEKPTPEERLSILVQAPVDSEYGSFAGDFYVNGTVVWDAKDKTVKMQKTEEVRHDEFSTYEV